MVDWKKLGKTAFDVTKDVTEKGIDSFQDWKDDPERIAKVEKQKAEKRAKKKVAIAEKSNEKRRNKKKINKDPSTSTHGISFVVSLLGKTTITVLDKAVLIDREGSMQNFKGKNVIPFAQISSVIIQPATSLSNGYIRFSTPGGVQLRNGLLNAPTDANSIIFSKKSNKDMEKLRDLVENAMLNLYEVDKS